MSNYSKLDYFLPMALVKETNALFNIVGKGGSIKYDTWDFTVNDGGFSNENVSGDDWTHIALQAWQQQTNGASLPIAFTDKLTKTIPGLQGKEIVVKADAQPSWISSAYDDLYVNLYDNDVFVERIFVDSSVSAAIIPIAFKAHKFTSDKLSLSLTFETSASSTLVIFQFLSITVTTTNLAVNVGATKDPNGFSFDGIDDFINSNYNAKEGNNWNLLDAQFGFFLYDNISAGANVRILGVSEPAFTNITNVNDNASNTAFRINTSTARFDLVGGHPSKSLAEFTINATNTKRYIDGSEDATAANTATEVPDRTIKLGAEDNGGTIGSFWEGTLSTFHAGATIGVDQVARDANVRQLLTDLGLNLSATENTLQGETGSDTLQGETGTDELKGSG